MVGRYASLIDDAVRKNHSLVLGCHCAVRYSGRAESFLDFGDRLIIVKGDNTLLVHQASGNNPVNYMKPGSAITVSEEGDQVKIHAEHAGLKEFMDILVKTVYFFDDHKLEESCDLVLEGTEKDMSDMLYANPELVEKGFKAVSREEQTRYGFVDVLGYDKDSVLCVVECKRYGGDFGAVDQLRRYVEKVKKSKGVEKVRGILACPKVTPNALKMLGDFGFSHVVVHPPKQHRVFKKSQTRLNQF